MKRRIRRLYDEGEHLPAYFLCKDIPCLYRGTIVRQIGARASGDACAVSYVLTVLSAIATNPGSSTRWCLEGHIGEVLNCEISSAYHAKQATFTGGLLNFLRGPSMAYPWEINGDGVKRGRRSVARTATKLFRVPSRLRRRTKLP